MAIKAVLFDLDGTLLDSIPAILESTEATFRSLDIPYDREQAIKLIGLPFAIQTELWAGERAEEFAARYREIHGARVPDSFFPRTKEMLSGLKSRGLLLGLVTSKRLRSAERALNQGGIAGYFDTIITADMCVNHKPDPEPVVRALQELNMQPDEAVFVGDSLYDVHCAMGAGVTMVGVSWGVLDRDQLLEANAAAVFDNWKDFEEWLDANSSRVTS